MSQKKFASKLGVTKTAVSKMELENYNMTDTMIKLLCWEYKVDFLWLTTGEGEMFSDSENDIMEMIECIMTGENEIHKNLFKTFAMLDEKDLRALEVMDNKFNEIKKVDS